LLKRTFLAGLALLLASANSHANQVDCSQWIIDGEGLGTPAIRLGSFLSEIKKVTRLDSRSEARHFDGLEVNKFKVEPWGPVLETIRCIDEREMIVGITSGGFVPGHHFLDEWISQQENDLRQSGVKVIHRGWRGSDFYLWGIRASLDTSNLNGVTDHLVLERRCRQPDQGKNFKCGLASWHVHFARSSSMQREK
jgi:hypothetical protein